MRSRVENAFKTYTDNYDSSDEKIYLKIYHTYQVASICERIARSIGMDERDIDIAWLLGMLHDTGRFEQVKRYNTFNDSKSVDHAELGADILFVEDSEASKIYRQSLMRATSLLTEERELIEVAIRAHNKYRIPNGLSIRQQDFCNLLRDADKVDILRVNVETPFEVIYNVSMEELKKSPITKEVFMAFNEGHAVLRSLKKHPIDNLVGHISLVYELVYKESKVITREQGFLHRMLSFQSENPETREQLKEIREKMLRFIEA